ncbi:hypothetical protein FNT36_16190 [Hymenobacter setariae]|uniref:Uncharacterized protein n=1 Tax=Hymenobacter setariae TaxID=2594794 RepID=A0A558BRQ5_9BACT|nr:hypothetical protein [Hymenobacter setariae]TVT39199.1 hypothetical protein FNT36_16190 [Hymenobacter setariae]
MKNSSKFLLAAVLVLLASLTAYNMALRTEYRLGTYKDPLRGFATLPLTGFSEVAVPAATTVSVKIVSGPFSVRINPRAQEFVHVRQQGTRLVIEADFPERQKFLGWGDGVVISCPRLTAVSADAVYLEAGQRRVDKGYPDNRIVRVQGFVQDSLTVRADNGSHVELTGNQLSMLRATTGAMPGSHASLNIEADNRIAAAQLDLRHQSELKMKNILIPGLRYQVSDSAQAFLSGAALRSLVQK